uniref:Chitin deacetylase 7 n=1 Tax=Tigriopus japonicus TaxID=158387 RepID=A0A1U9XQU8_TIGJA|nr:chitin deacetylase 7 [Tigriopus japonicus]
MISTMFLVAVLLAFGQISLAVDTEPSCPTNSPTIRSGKLPQFVVLTFDDAVNNELWEAIYTDIFDDLTDPFTRCDLKATFFISHNNTNYAKVNQLFHDGHEIALHSYSHGGDRQDSESLVRKFRMGRWALEIQQNINALIEHALLPKETYFGWRSPFLFTTGDESFTALNASNILYDSSLSFYEKSWPYPLINDKKSSSCLIKPCPSQDYLLMEAPLSVWTGIDNEVCAMMDACKYGSTREEAYEVMMANFRRFHEENVPMPISLHGGALINGNNGHFREAFIDFLRTLLGMRDVHFVTMRQLVEFSRNPKNTFQFMREARRACVTFRPKESCQPKRPACEFKNTDGENSVYLHTCAKRCPSQRLEIAFDYFGKSCCEA